MSKNLTKKRAIEIAEELGVTPIEILLKSMALAWAGLNRVEACRLAEIAAPYVHPRLAASQVSHDGEVTQRVISDTPEPLTIEQWEENYSPKIEESKAREDLN